MNESIIDKAAELLANSKITYKQISQETGLKFTWLLSFNNRYKKGQDFHARKIETLIKYLTKENQ